MLSRERGQAAAQLEAANRRITELTAENARLRARDPLVTRLLTLAAFRVQLDMDVSRAHRHGRPLTVAVLDIDRFRYLNMTRGYTAGDAALAAVGSLLAQRTRAHDLACRCGADEFAVMLPETSAEEARGLVERVLIELENLDVGGQRGVSVSAGLAVLAPQGTADTILAHATRALDQARTEGGGRVAVASAEALGAPEDLAGANVDVVAALAQALEERDRYTGEHSESVVDLVARVAEELAIDVERMKSIRSAALLHDIGKVGIPDEILHKPGPLDESEWQIMRQHPAIGERILRAIPGMGAVARIVRHEHERWDGGGYPDGLAGADIPAGARIILACDAYHAMVSDRPYRKAMSHQDAMNELTSNAGSQFDPSVIEALVGYLYGRRQSGLTAV